ncbi:MAG: DPP IV N-terminal domain-containing protein [Paludibacteraceae bacterium]|nr:DPP IV N-terminal domain-containing protein [Paludibacteraceae bacterium]
MIAQKKLTLDDVTPGGTGYKKQQPKTLEQLQWCGDTLLFVRDSCCIEWCATTQKETLICSLSDLNEALSAVSIKPQKNIPPFFCSDKNLTLCFCLPKQLVFYNCTSKKIQQLIKLKKDWRNKDFCSQTGNIAFTTGNGLLVISGKEVLKITNKREKNSTYGQAVHRNEFGITKGTFWSPQGNYLAFYRKNESLVADYILTDNSKKPPSSKNIKYPAVGEKSEQVTIGIYSIKTGKTIYLKTGEPLDRYFTNLCWTPTEKELIVAELNRNQNSCTLKAYDIQTGKGRMLFTESSNTYVEPEKTPLFINNNNFIWQSERSGHNHLYRYNLTDSTCQTLTSGNWDVLELNGYNKEKGFLIFSATKNSALEKNVYRLDLASGKIEELSATGGQHEVLVSETANYIVDNFSSLTIPRSINLINIHSKATTNLLLATNAYAGYTLPEIKLGTIKCADKKNDLYYRLTLPVDFDENKKYPVIVYVYGGPHVQLVQNTWLGGSKGWELFMGQEGFICFSVDGRGSANRGQAFEEAIYGNIGKAPLEDQLQGIAFLKKLPYVDSTRMGVYGWSFGGFMSTQLMTKTPELFKVGVAGGAVIDWRLYEVMYGERYMQTPQLNAKGYEENDLTNYAKNLQGHFLMIHCELDPVVRIINTERFLDAAKAAGKKVEFIRYQKHEHNVQGKERVDLFEKITAFFVDNL